MRKQRRLTSTIVLGLLWLCVIAAVTLGAVTYLNPFMLTMIFDVQFGSDLPVKTRIAKWQKLFETKGRHQSLEWLADWTNASGFTYQDEVEHTGQDINRLMVSKWLFQQTLYYAAKCEPSKKRTDQISFANSL